jgi:hypothetical protein
MQEKKNEESIKYVQDIIDRLMTPKWRRSTVVPFNIEKVVEPTMS